MPAPSSSHPAHDATVWLVPRPVPPTTVRVDPRTVRLRRSRCATAFELVARFGTAVTLAALLVVTGTVLGLFDTAPVPTASAGR